MGLRDSFRRVLGYAGGDAHPDGLGELHVGDAGYDGWDLVQDFEELETARAFRQTLVEHGFQAVLTADWEVDEFCRGDIALRVPAGRGLEAEELLDSD